jgi:hypothetical protein
MSSRVEDAIRAYASDRNPTSLAALNAAVFEENFFVPTAAEPVKTGPGRFNLAVVCMKTTTGAAIPAFTTTDQLLLWKPEGCDYTTLAGAALMAMAAEMTEVSEILINPDGNPRGIIPRADFGKIRYL